jgi:hypothetical protein
VWDRPALLAFGLYTLAALVFFGPGLLPGHTTSSADYLWSAAPWNTAVPPGLFHWSSHPLVVGSSTQLVDPTTVFEPYLQYTRSQLPHIPLWNPYIMGGTPYLGDMQSAIFSPFSLPAYILPFWWSLSVIAVMKVVVAALGAFLLGRNLRMGFAGAFLCGLVFGFGLFMVAWLPWPLTNVFALIPWLLLATERLIRRPDPWSVAGLALVVALQFFGGHPESSVHALFAALAYFVLRVLQSPGGGAAAMAEAARRGGSRLAALAGAARRPAVGFVVALVAGTAMAAIVLLPFFELLHHSSDLTSRPRSLVHVQPKYFLAALLPGYYPAAFEIETGFYAGALPLMLAVVALFRPRVERVVIAVFGVLCVVVVLGIQPLFGFVGHLPGFDATYLSRLTILYLLCVALLAGWGLDDLIRERPRGRRATGVLVVAGVLLVLPVVVVVATRGTSLRFLSHALHLAWAFGTWPTPASPHVDPIARLATLVVWITVALAALIVLVLRVRVGIGPVVFAVLALLLVVGDLFQAGMGYNPAIPQSHAVQPVTPAIRYLQHQAPARFVGVQAYGGINPIPPDVNMRYGLYDARGYDLPVVTSFGKLWSRYVSPPTPLLPLNTPAAPTLTLELRPYALRALSILGVRDLLQEKGDAPLHLPGLHVVYNGPDATIYANAGALPRTWLVDDQQVVPDENAALARLVSPSFDPRRAVLTGRALPGLARVPTGGAPRPSPGTARIVHYGTEQVTIESRSRRPAELVLSDTYYPGWRVAVDGRPARIDRVDGLFRGVPVPAGTHRVEFTYDPASYRTGVIVTIVATLAVVTAAVVGFERRRRRRRSRTGRGSGSRTGRGSDNGSNDGSDNGTDNGSEAASSAPATSAP